MNTQPQPTNDAADIFGPVIYSYTRAQAIADGYQLLQELGAVDAERARLAAQHELGHGRTDEIDWLASQQRGTFARVGGGTQREGGVRLKKEDKG